MIALIQLAFFGCLVLILIYVMVSAYSRSTTRERLEKRWDAGTDPGAATFDRDAYIEQGMRAYERSLRKKLIWLVFVVPIAVVALVVYLVNYA